MTLENLKTLKSKLPRGWQDTIATKAGVSPTLVSHVLNGKRKNTNVINHAIDLAEEKKKEDEQMIAKIHAL